MSTDLEEMLFGFKTEADTLQSKAEAVKLAADRMKASAESYTGLYRAVQEESPVRVMIGDVELSFLEIPYKQRLQELCKELVLTRVNYHHDQVITRSRAMASIATMDEMDPPLTPPMLTTKDD